LEYVAYSCFKQNKGINEMNGAHAYEMHVQMQKPNTWGVTSLPLIKISTHDLESVPLLIEFLVTLS
jgi:hypothetical protein